MNFNKILFPATLYLFALLLCLNRITLSMMDAKTDKVVGQGWRAG